MRIIKIIVKSIIITNLLLIAGCDRHPVIEINRDYIYNSSWNKSNLPSVSFSKVEIDSIIYKKDFNSLTGFDIHNSIVIDSLNYNPKVLPYTFFTYRKNKKVVHKKIYFSKYNEGVEWRTKSMIHSSKKIIGRLDLDSWYLFYHLHPNWLYYVNINKKGKINVWKVSPVNI